MVGKEVEALISILGVEKLFLLGSAQYNASLSSYFSPQAGAVHPACFIAPQSVTDVSAVITSLTSRNSHESRNFAVRASGHTAPGGITIDLRGLNSIRLSTDKSTVSAGSGATWDAVYSQLEREGLSVVVTSFEVVLANGSVVVADEKQNADVWWGLRGGPNNFGIVTRFSLRTFEQGLLWSILTLNPLTEVDNQARINGGIMAAENYDVNASFITGWVFASQHGVSATLNQLIYTRLAEGETSAFYKPILELPTVSSISTTATVANVSTIAQKPQAARYVRFQYHPPTPFQVGKRDTRDEFLTILFSFTSYMTATTTFMPTEDMIRATYEAFNAPLSLAQGVAGIMWAIYKRGGANNNALGLSEYHGSLAVGLGSPSWPDAGDDEAVYDAARSLVADIENRAKRLGVYNQYIYLDYAAPWQGVINGYGDKNVKKLQELRKRVDPRKVFTNMVKGRFKIPEEGH
ncbi:hypothetical protein Hte_010570 [Hypoxylon texense]